MQRNPFLELEKYLNPPICLSTKRAEKRTTSITLAIISFFIFLLFYFEGSPPSPWKFIVFHTKSCFNQMNQTAKYQGMYQTTKYQGTHSTSVLTD